MFFSKKFFFHFSSYTKNDIFHGKCEKKFFFHIFSTNFAENRKKIKKNYKRKLIKVVKKKLKVNK